MSPRPPFGSSLARFARPAPVLLFALCSSLLVACLQGGSAQTPPPPGPPSPPGSPPPPVTGSFPILFVTQVPIKADFTTIASSFGNHHADMDSVGRGGDLWIRYPDGSLKNLTQTAGFGNAGLQQGNSIAVRDPSVHWDGSRAVFSMVVGAPTAQYQVKDFYWQLYEVTGLGKTDTPAITRVPNQPQNYNNVSPIYGTDDRIIFTTDRPRGGERHLYPQHDEYESSPTVSGLWSLDPASGDLKLLNHAPSGDFTPILDSFGRVVFTQWDHLKRDQQADADKYAGGTYGTFNYASEAADAAKLTSRTEVFPEPRVPQETAGTNLNPHDFNQFFPWTILEDGSEGETLNHIGRQELHSYIPQSLNNDPSLSEYYGQTPRVNPNPINNLLQLKEDPLHPGTYVGTDAPEFYTHGSGQIVSLEAPPGLSAERMKVSYLTHRDTSGSTDEGKTPTPDHSGHYRDPLPLSNGQLIAAHTAETRAEGGTGGSRYDFRLKTLKKLPNGFWVADAALTNGLEKSVQYWDPDQKISYSGKLWELQPVEVKARARPARLTLNLAAPEQGLVTQAGVDLARLRAYLVQNNLAIAVTRNVTTRDDLDRQQPFDLRVPGGTQTLASDYKSSDKVYDVAHLQFFQGDQLRGIGGTASPRAGRRVIAQVMHDPQAIAANPSNPGGPSGSVKVADDGSAAAFVPARRALSWQLTDPNGTPVVRERYWVTFQPGEIRVCTSCHGLNETDQAGRTVPVNPPKALLDLLKRWKSANP